MRIALRVAALTALWLLAWGELSVANVVSGVAVAAGLLVAFPPAEARVAVVRLAVVGFVRLTAYVIAQLVSSNVAMTMQIVRAGRRDRRPGVIVLALREPSDLVVTVMTSIISLSPGTMTVDVTEDASVVHVHVFDLPAGDAAERSLRRLEQLVLGAFPRRHANGRTVAG